MEYIKLSVIEDNTTTKGDWTFTLNEVKVAIHGEEFILCGRLERNKEIKLNDGSFVGIVCTSLFNKKLEAVDTAFEGGFRINNTSSQCLEYLHASANQLIDKYLKRIEEKQNREIEEEDILEKKQKKTIRGVEVVNYICNNKLPIINERLEVYCLKSDIEDAILTKEYEVSICDMLEKINYKASSSFKFKEMENHSDIDIFNYLIGKLIESNTSIRNAFIMLEDGFDVDDLIDEDDVT